MKRFKTIDAHVVGAPLRLVIDGVPPIHGETMLDKRAWMMRHADAVRRITMLEPRGHADMCGALLTEPVSPNAHAGILFMDTGGFPAMSGHGIIGATTIVLERGLLLPGGDGRTILFDTAAGAVRATASLKADTDGRTVEHVSVRNVPAFVVEGGMAVMLGTRRLRVDLAFGGAFYAIVDSESVGVPVDAAHLSELRRAAEAIRAAIERSTAVQHPVEPRLTGLQGVIVTAPPTRETAALRSVTISTGGQVERSASGTGTAAVMAVLDVMGLMDDDLLFVHEGLLGTALSGRIAGRTLVGDYPAVVAEIGGRAWISGEHTFILADDDPLANGFRL